MVEQFFRTFHRRVKTLRFKNRPTGWSDAKNLGIPETLVKYGEVDNLYYIHLYMRVSFVFYISVLYFKGKVHKSHKPEMIIRVGRVGFSPNICAGLGAWRWPGREYAHTHIYIYYSYIKLCVSIVYIYTHIILFVISNVLFVLLLISVDDKIFCVLESFVFHIFPGGMTAAEPLEPTTSLLPPACLCSYFCQWPIGYIGYPDFTCIKKQDISTARFITISSL